MAPVGNHKSGISLSQGAENNVIGGTTANSRNLISDNHEDGILISGTGTSGNTVEGNYIGITATGSGALQNHGLGGVVVNAGAQSNLIGGTVAGARNVISGNGNFGIIILDSGSDNNLVQGNYMGTDPTGTVAIPNALTGVQVSGGAQNCVVGGTAPGAGNLLSGNLGGGVLIGFTSQLNSIQGNTIGTNAAGTAALGNAGDGVMLFEGGNNLVGGTAPGARNLISGNGSTGVQINGTGASGNTVQGNYIGTNAAGTAAIANAQDGVRIFGGNISNNIIGGTTAATRNIIAGNGANGVQIYQQFSNSVEGNYIGTDASGTAPLPNLANGVIIEFGGATQNVIGGAASGAGNVIAFNAVDGVFIMGGGSDDNLIQANTITHNGRDGVHIVDGINNTITANSISANTGLGINLQPSGEPDSTVTPNDLNDGDAGPNNLQNFPVIRLATSSGGGTLVSGTLNSRNTSNYTIDVYSSASPDPSGFGEGQVFLGSTFVTTDENNNATFSFSVNANVQGQFLTATATNSDFHATSEFSHALRRGNQRTGADRHPRQFQRSGHWRHRHGDAEHRHFVTAGRHLDQQRSRQGDGTGNGDHSGRRQFTHLWSNRRQQQRGGGPQAGHDYRQQCRLYQRHGDRHGDRRRHADFGPDRCTDPVQ